MNRRIAWYLSLVFSLLVVAMAGCDTGTYENRFDEHFEGSVVTDELGEPTIL